MKYSIKVEGNEYIKLVVEGVITSKAAVNMNIEAHALGAKLSINRYLVDLTNARNHDTITEQYNFAYNDMSSNPKINKLARVALLVMPDDNSHDFLVTVARNSGQNIHLFYDEDNAKMFLFS